MIARAATGEPRYTRTVRVLKRIVAAALVAIVAVAMTVRPVCAAACHRAAAAAGVEAPGPSASPSHCAGMTHAARTSTARIAAAEAHPCGEHARLMADDARLPRVDAGVTMPAIADPSPTIVTLSPPTHRHDARRSGLPPPGPPRAPLVLRV